MKKESLTLLAAAALVLAAAPAPAPAGAGALVINEVRIDQPGTDNDEYFELAGAPGQSLTGLTYVVLGDEEPPGAGGSGVIEVAVSLAGQSIRPSGFFVAAESTFSLGLPNLITLLNFENGDNVTHLLVQNFTGAVGQDLDTNDDGVLDIVPWTAVIDCIALVLPGVPGVDGDYIYCAQTVGPDDIFVPGQAYRCSPDGTWKVGPFDPNDPGATDTPGAVNTSCDFAPPCGGDLAGDCFVANGTPFCSDLACCQLIIDNFNPFCAVVWDQSCADLALVECLGCGDAGTGDCFEPNGTPYCNNMGCCTTVCGLDPTCCQIAGWDQACADLANASCIISVVQQGDVIVGHSDAVADASLDLVRGPVMLNGGAAVPDAWAEPFIQDVELDNLDNILHNPAGNLLGLNFGAAAAGGSVHNLAACQAAGPGIMIGNTTGLGGAGLTLTRLTGLSVSPDNSKIACGGYDSGQVIVYDYVAGDCLGAGASLSGARQTTTVPLCIGDTQGTAWLDAGTVLAYSSNGFLFSINATTMVATPVALLPGNCPSSVTAVEYNPAVAPYVYCLDGAFSVVTTNTLTVLDPGAAWALVATVDYSSSIDTTRDLAFDRSGNLYVVQFGGSVDVIQGADNPPALLDNGSIDWYTPVDGSGFNGIDVAVGLPGEVEPCPWDCAPPADGNVDTIDFLALLAQWGLVGGPCDFDNNGVDTVDFLALLAHWGPCP